MPRHLKALQQHKNQLIRDLWRAFAKLTDHTSQMSEEDLDLWDKITAHSAVQKRLDQGK